MPLPIKKSAGSALSRNITKQEIFANLQAYKKAIAFFRYYPDKLVDLFIAASGPNCSFKLYPYQRLILRAMARYRHVFLTFSRGTSKSFLDNLWNILQCILYPNTKLGIVASTKNQSASIIEAKFSEILTMIPALEYEVLKKTKLKDQFAVIFKNGSFYQNVAAKQSTRGLRFTGLTLEELIEADETMIQEVILPTLAIPRRMANGKYNNDEPITQQQIVVTTAGFRGTYAHAVLMKTLLQDIVEPDKALVLGGSYRIPIIAGLQTIDFIRDQQQSGEFNPTSFAREYLSRWSVGSENAYFPSPTFDKFRSLQEPDWDNTNLPRNGGYIMSIDCGRFSDQSEITVWKYIPSTGTTSTKHLVFLYSMVDMPFDRQALEIKKFYELYKPQQVVVDGNGIGAGLVDELVKPQMDYATGQFLRPWGVSNDDKDYYRQFKTSDTINNILYVVKASATYNTEMYANLQTQLMTGKLRFLCDQSLVRNKIETSKAKRFVEMTDEQKADYLQPFIQTTLLRDQMANLEEKREGINIILQQTNKKMKKDKVSAMGMGLYYIKLFVDDPMMSRQVGVLDMFTSIGARSSMGSRPMPSITFRGNGQYMSNRRR